MVDVIGGETLVSGLTAGERRLPLEPEDEGRGELPPDKLPPTLLI